MKIHKYYVLLMSIFLFSFTGPFAAAKEPLKIKIGQGRASISLIEGAVKALSPGHKEWRSLRVDDKITQGDEILTGSNAKLELLLIDGSRLRFDQNTRFVFETVGAESIKKAANVRAHIFMGKSWANVMSRISGKSKFELSCTNAVAGVRGTIYRMDVNDDKSAVVKVYEGAVEVSSWTGRPSQNAPYHEGPPQKVAGPKPVSGPKKISREEWTFLIKSMQQIRINADGTTEKPEEFDVKKDEDDWGLWNKSRDKSIDALR